MMITRQPLICTLSLAAVLALSACGKHEPAEQPAATPPPVAAEPATPPPAMAPAAVSFSTVELGSQVDANNKITASGDSFAPSDTIYASIDTSGSGNATLSAKWSYQDGQVVHEDSKSIAATGPETTAFMISKPSGFPAGNYKVDVSLNGQQVASKDFSVK